MSTGQRFGGYPAVFGYTSSQTMALAHVEAFDLQANNTVGVMRPPGQLDPAAYVLARSQPVFSLRTPDISTVLGTLSFTAGKLFDEASTFYLQERADGGAFLSGSTHVGRRTQKGFMYVDNITVDQGDPNGAMCNLMYIPLRVGSNAVVAYLSASALPATTPAYTSSYFLASPYHNSTEIKGCFSLTITPGIQFAPSPASPGAFDTIGSIIQREAQFTFRCLKVDEFDSFQIGGDAVNTSFAFYLQKADATMSTADGRVAVGSGSHLKISCTAGRIETRSLSVDGVADAGIEVTVFPTGTPSFSTSSTIP